LRDQIIEGLQEVDTVEDLLKEKDLTLATTITRCRSHKAAKKHCLDITHVEPGTIAPVTEATQRCAPIVVTPKKGTELLRMCVDLSKLNMLVVRERYMSPTPAEAVADIAAKEAKYFTVIDADKDYHQCPLAPERQELTTFITL